MKKIIVNFLCCLLPNQKWRKEVRNRFVKLKDRQKTLENYGCVITGDVAVTAEGIQFDISDYAKVCNHIKEILVDEAYNIKCKEDSVVIDIGMNRGVASLFFAAKKNVRNVYAFEPFSPTVALAERNLALNPELSKKIHIFTYGLGKKDTILKVPYSIDVSDCMSTTHAIPLKQNIQMETIKIKDVAQIFAPIFEENKANRILLKCDCEGAEFEILERLDEANLVENIDVALMEYHFEKPDRLVDILLKNGFAVHVRHGGEEPITGYLYAVKMQHIS